MTILIIILILSAAFIINYPIEKQVQLNPIVAPIPTIISTPTIVPTLTPTPINSFSSFFNDKKGYVTKIYPTSIKKREYLFIGDSIMVSVASKLYDKLGEDINLDAKVGRQFSEANSILSKYKDFVGDNVVIGLGTNGDVSKEELENILNVLNNKNIILINNKVPRSWKKKNNKLFKDVVQSHKNVKLIDWYNNSIYEDGIFQSDGIHLTKGGIDYYVNLILKNL